MVLTPAQIVFWMTVTLGLGIVIFAYMLQRDQSRIRQFFWDHSELLSDDLLRHFERELGRLWAIHHLLSWAAIPLLAGTIATAVLDPRSGWLALVYLPYYWWVVPAQAKAFDEWHDEIEHEIDLHRAPVTTLPRRRISVAISRN